jgi:hypothetical protein
VDPRLLAGMAAQETKAAREVHAPAQPRTGNEPLRSPSSCFLPTILSSTLSAYWPQMRDFVGPVFCLRIPISGLNLDHDLGQPCAIWLGGGEAPG